LKTFIQHDFPKLKRIDSEAGRVYETPTGQAYPSVTSVVGLHSASHIQAWRNRVGHAEANRISSRASKRGTAIHSLCEDFILGKNPQPHMADYEMFSTIKPHLEVIDNIHCLETQLFSHKLQVAGTVDCIAEYNGKLHIIDFKTSGRVKVKGDIHNYFMQTAAYSFMFWEMTGVMVDRSLIIMGVDDHDVLIFDESITPWLKKFQDLRVEYRALKGN
jgi:genome maintenance exonuclease 1